MYTALSVISQTPFGSDGPLVVVPPQISGGRSNGPRAADHPVAIATALLCSWRVTSSEPQPCLERHVQAQDPLPLDRDKPSTSVLSDQGCICGLYSTLTFLSAPASMTDSDYCIVPAPNACIRLHDKCQWQGPNEWRAG